MLIYDLIGDQVVLKFNVKHNYQAEWYFKHYIMVVVLHVHL